jgi:glycosyltransferase involved in cell wall biosynthesis
LLLGYASRFDRAAFYEAWRGGYPLLFRGETTDHAHGRSRAKRLARDTALRLLYNRMARLLYIGQRSRRHYERLGGPAEKLIFAPYCVDVTPFRGDEAARDELRTATRGAWDIAEDETVAVFSGKLSPRKGPDLLLQAAKKLPDGVRAKFHVLFVGEGELKGEAQRLAESPPPVKTTFAGFQNQTQLSRFYHAADLLVLPSRWGETWGLVVNEALHHGLPCVVSDAVGCAPDLIAPGVTGATFASGDAEGLRAAVQSVLPLLGREETRRACRAAVSRYSVSAAAQGIAQAYREVADACRRVASG